MNQSEIVLDACCGPMSRQLNWRCGDHPSREECPDALIARFGKKGAYGLLIHDGGSSHIEIAYCPWCGAKLREKEGVEAQPLVHEIADGDVVLWSVDGTVHIKTTNKHNDPVELNEHQALELSDLLTQLVTGNPLLGTWKLKSYVVTAATGVQATPYGENSTGYLSYSADGRMQVIGAASGRTVQAGPSPAEIERAALYDTMFAYAGTYSVEAGKVTHHVDISWNEAWTGTDQIRLFEVNGNFLTLTTRVADPDSDTEALYALIWEKVSSPC